MASNYKFINKLREKRVLIFGGTSGIGFAVTQGVLEFGGNVIITGSNQPKLDRTVERLKEIYPDLDPSMRITTCLCDLSGVEKLESNLKELLEKVTSSGSQKIDHVAFTAGDSLSVCPFSDVTLEKLSAASNIRVLAPVFLLKLLPAYMPSSATSSITFTSGTNGDRPSPDWGLIAAMCTSLEGLIRGAAIDLAPIRVNLASPGAIDTELLANAPKELKEHFANETLLKKMSTPDDMAEVYLYCMRDSFATGTVYRSDGGRLLKG